MSAYQGRMAGETEWGARERLDPRDVQVIATLAVGDPVGIRPLPPDGRSSACAEFYAGCPCDGCVKADAEDPYSWPRVRTRLPSS